MNIGQAALESGVTAKMIRYYEQIGLVRPAGRTLGNYRSFDDRDLNELRFIKRARSLGFSVKEIGNLLALWRDRDRPSGEIKAVADDHVAKLEARIAEIHGLLAAFRDLSHRCDSDERPEFPRLAEAAEGASLGRGERGDAAPVVRSGRPLY
jgi:MerR family copper efflux transcriptional regulator